MKSTTVIAVDIAKSVFEVAVSRRPGTVSERQRKSRSAFLPFFAERQAATVVMEACSSAHHWARRLVELGHEVILLPPRLVRPYRTGNKTDRADAKALLEAFRNKEIQPVPIKTLEQHTIIGLLRLRAGWMKDRNGRMNTVRGLLRELGLVVPAGTKSFRTGVWEIIEDAETPLHDALRFALAEAYLEVVDLDERIHCVEQQLQLLARDLEAVQLLRMVPGIGLLSATALYAVIGNVHRFPTARHLASFIGLTPREHSSGLRRRLGRISKRGDVAVRTFLIHGGRSFLRAAKSTKQPDRFQSWALELEHRSGHNRAATAVANKLARIAWAVWRTQTPYRSATPTASATPVAS